MKDVVEKCFDDLKNALDSKRLRVHRADRMKSRLFIQFISLILLSQVRKVLQEKLAGKGYSVKSLLWELESLTTIHYSGKYMNKLSELTRAQKDIFAAFDVKIDP
jgi:transposase